MHMCQTSRGPSRSVLKATRWLLVASLHQESPCSGCGDVQKQLRDGVSRLHKKERRGICVCNAIGGFAGFLFIYFFMLLLLFFLSR